jgi:hypothetical protein
MVLIHWSATSKRSYPKQVLWIYQFIQIPFYWFLLCQYRSTSSSFFVLSGRLIIPLHTGASGDFRWIWPNHHKRCWTNFSWIGATPCLSSISSFLIRSPLVCLHIQQNICILATLIFLMCYSFIAQYSASYIITSVIVVL